MEHATPCLVSYLGEGLGTGGEPSLVLHPKFRSSILRILMGLSHSYAMHRNITLFIGSCEKYDDMLWGFAYGPQPPAPTPPPSRPPTPTLPPRPHQHCCSSRRGLVAFGPTANECAASNCPHNNFNKPPTLQPSPASLLQRPCCATPLAAIANPQRPLPFHTSLLLAAHCTQFLLCSQPRKPVSHPRVFVQSQPVIATVVYGTLLLQHRWWCTNRA